MENEKQVEKSLDPESKSIAVQAPARFGKSQQIFLNLAPKSAAEAMQVASALAKSTMVPACYRGKPEDVLVAMQLSIELGLNPMQGLQNIAVINNRPCLWGDAVIALVRNSGKSEFVRETMTGSGDNLVAVCETKRVGDPTAHMREFSVSDAKRAGLWQDKASMSPWWKYPKRMLQMRARSWCLRDVYPDVLTGISVAEEQMDIVETQAVNDTQAPASDAQKIREAETTMTAQDDETPAQRCEKAMEHFGFEEAKRGYYFDTFEGEEQILVEYFVKVARKELTIQQLDAICEKRFEEKTATA